MVSLLYKTCVYLVYILKWHISIMMVYFPGFDSSFSLDIVLIKLGAAPQTQIVLYRMNTYVDIFFVYQRTKQESFIHTTFYLLLIFFLTFKDKYKKQGLHLVKRTWQLYLNQSILSYFSCPVQEDCVHKRTLSDNFLQVLMSYLTWLKKKAHKEPCVRLKTTLSLPLSRGIYNNLKYPWPSGIYNTKFMKCFHCTDSETIAIFFNLNKVLATLPNVQGN